MTKPPMPASSSHPPRHAFDYDPAGKLHVEDFILEADEILNQMQNECVLMERSPTRDVVDRVFRLAHTLKGSSGMIGLGAMYELTHLLESVLDSVRRGKRTIDRDIIDLLLGSLDEIRSILDKLKTGEPFQYDIGEAARRIVDVTGVTLSDDAPHAAEASADNTVPIVQTTEPVRKPAPPPDPRTSPAAAAQPDASQSIRVDIGKLDKVISLVGELAISRIRFEQRIHDIESLRDRFSHVSRSIRDGADAQKLQTAVEVLDINFLENVENQRRVSEEFQQIASELQAAVMRTRMVPISHALCKFPRMVRDISNALQKPVNLLISGENTEIDKIMVERIGDPLMHLVRNAIDHGIEPAGERVRLGKPAEGAVSIRAFYMGDQVVIQISDDGAGIRRERVVAKALEKGMITADEAADLPDQRIHEFIFQPGFSTAVEVTDVSGRGVGMDVVMDTIRGMKGTVDIESKSGQGSTVTIKLPLTLAIIQVLMVKAGKRRLALPLSAIQETLSVPPEEIHTIGPHEVFNLRGEPVSLVGLDALLDGGGTGRHEGYARHIVVAASGHDKVGFEVDGFEGKREVVVKTLGSVLRRVKYTAGSTIMGDGSLILIADMASLVRACRTLENTSGARPPTRADTEAGEPEPAARAQKTPTLLIVDDSQMIHKILRTAIEEAGFRVFAALDGAKAIEIARREKIDALVTDLVMPRMDGYELCRQIREWPATRHIPVILMSTKGEKMDKIRGFEAGADEYLVKPFEPSVLLDRISRLLKLTR